MLKQTERQLNNNCKALEARVAAYMEVLPMCKQVVGLGIGLPELLALHTAVLNKADTDNLPRQAAAYCVMEDIEDYNKLIGMKKQLNDVATQIFMMNQFLGRQKNAITALFKLQTRGMTEDQILSACRLLENGNGMTHTTTQ